MCELYTVAMCLYYRMITDLTMVYNCRNMNKPNAISSSCHVSGGIVKYEMCHLVINLVQLELFHVVRELY